MNHVRPQKARAALHLQRLEAGGVFLDREVGNGGSQVEAGREAERRKRIVRRHLDVLRLGQRRDLPRAGDAAAERHVDARVLRGPAPREEGAEVVQGGVALARRAIGARTRRATRAMAFTFSGRLGSSHQNGR